MDDTFLSKSPAEQDAIVADIVSQVRGDAHSSEIDRDPPQAERGAQPPSGPPANRSAPETQKVLQRLISDIYPQAKFTSGKRSAERNKAVGGVENSYHVSGHGIDVVGLDAEERADLKSRLEGMGIRFDEWLYHKVKGGGLHLHIAATNVPENLFRMDDSERPKDIATAPLPSSPSLPSPTSLRTAQGPSSNSRTPAVPVNGPNSDGPGYFDMPDSLDQFSKGLALGAGNVVEGVGDTLGIVANPVNALIAKAMGYDNYTPDFGKTLRESVGLPGDDSLTGDVIAGLSGGVGFSGGAKLASKAAQSALARKALAELGATPVRDAVGGAGAAFASGIAERQGASAPVQVAAALAGGTAGALGLQKAATQGAKFIDSPTGDRLFPKIAQKRFEAKQAMNRYQSYDREIAKDVAGIVSNVSTTRSALKKAEKETIMARIGELEAYYLPYAEVKSANLAPSVKAKLKAAMDNRHVISPDELAALDDGTVAGAAVADAIRKVKRLRSTLPDVTDKANPKVAHFLRETLGSSVGSSLGYAAGGPIAGSVGGVVGASVAKRLGRKEQAMIAEKVEELVKQSRQFARMPAETMGSGSRAKAKDALAKLKQDAAETMDKPYLARLAAKKMEAENRKVGIRNDLDNVKPAGGWRGFVYDRTGLLPEQQDVGALSALNDGAISSDQFQAFLEAPDTLMAGNAGNALVDRLASFADSGKLQRDANWTPPEVPASSAPMVDAQGQPIRSYPAYQAGAAKNIARELQLLKELDEIDPVVSVLGEGPSAHSVRASEDASFSMSEADRTRAAAIRAELAGMNQAKGSKGKAQ